MSAGTTNPVLGESSFFLHQESGPSRFVQSVTELSKAYTLVANHAQASTTLSLDSQHAALDDSEIMLLNRDTIAALASPPGSGARGILRICGPETKAVVSRLFHPADSSAWNSATTARCHAGELQLARLRCGLPVTVAWWPNSRSYTGEPIAELHLIGSPPLLELALQELFRHGARAAQPGEFTLRAFLAGKLDLMQAEAVLGVIDADDSAALSTALNQLAGGVSHAIGDLRTSLMDLLADLEAGLDFVDEDIEFVTRSEIFARLATAREFVERLQADSQHRNRSTGRRRVVLGGLPNAGKSTLFNRMAGTSAAIVSEIAGTTRDWLSATIHRPGLSYDLIDTAGWELESLDIAGIAQTHRAGQFTQADLLVWCTSATLSSNERMEDDTLWEQVSHGHPNPLRILTQCDAAGSIDREKIVAVSALTGQGLDELRAAVDHRLTGSQRTSGNWLGMTAARCGEALQSAIAGLTQAEQAAGLGLSDELIAADLRSAIDALGWIIGAVHSDDLLDRIFSKFCIGK